MHTCVYIKDLIVCTLRSTMAEKRRGTDSPAGVMGAATLQHSGRTHQPDPARRGQYPTGRAINLVHSPIASLNTRSSIQS